MVYRYSVSLTQPPQAPSPATRLDHVYSEFTLDLPPVWRAVPSEEDDTLCFHAEAEDAALIVSVDFIDTPADGLQALAEQALARRIAAIGAAGRAPVQLLQQQTRPHGSGAALELSCAAELAGEQVHLYLGYASTRKLLHFLMVGGPDRAAAVALFNATVGHFKPRLP